MTLQRRLVMRQEVGLVVILVYIEYKEHNCIF